MESPDISPSTRDRNDRGGLSREASKFSCSATIISAWRQPAWRHVLPRGVRPRYASAPQTTASSWTASPRASRPCSPLKDPRMNNIPAGWPSDRPLAISLAVMLEGWAEPDAPGIGPMGNPLKPGTVDLQARSWADYGAKVGAWRLLDLLDQQGVRAVFYTSGVVAELYPDLPASIARRGHVVAAHGWSQGTLPPYLSEAAEAADITR